MGIIYVNRVSETFQSSRKRGRYFLLQAVKQDDGGTSAPFGHNHSSSFRYRLSQFSSRRRSPARGGLPFVVTNQESYSRSIDEIPGRNQSKDFMQPINHYGEGNY